jgi:hypothetical protein
MCATAEQVDAAAALAQLISAQGMNNHNYLLFLTLLETNNPFVVNVLIGDRNPFLLFAPIKPNWYLLKQTFRILAKYKGNELAENALLALMGIVQNAYKTSKDGYTIYPLSMSDVYSIGKHLDKERDQLDPHNRLLLDILFDIYYVGIDSEDRSTIRIGIKANDIRMAFFDDTKKMVDALPNVLLVKEAARAPTGPKNFSWTGTPGAQGGTLSPRKEAPPSSAQVVARAGRTNAPPNTSRRRRK